MALTLYYSPGACSLAAHIVLEDIGADFALRRVLVSQGETHSPSFLALNPKGRVPLLTDDDWRLTEAVAILTHLADAHPEAGLSPPKGGRDAARVLELCTWLSNTVHVAYAGLWRPERFTDDEAARKALTKDAMERIGRLNDQIEARIAATAFAGGDAYTFADPFLLVFFRWANRIGLNTEALYPQWTRWARKIEARPAVQRALATEEISLWK